MPSPCELQIFLTLRLYHTTGFLPNCLPACQITSSHHQTLRYPHLVNYWIPLVALQCESLSLFHKVVLKGKKWPKIEEI